MSPLSGVISISVIIIIPAVSYIALMVAGGVGVITPSPILLTGKMTMFAIIISVLAECQYNQLNARRLDFDSGTIILFEEETRTSGADVISHQSPR